jgi:hypothetical protein
MNDGECAGTSCRSALMLGFHGACVVQPIGFQGDFVPEQDGIFHVNTPFYDVEG